MPRLESAALRKAEEAFAKDIGDGLKEAMIDAALRYRTRDNGGQTDQQDLSDVVQSERRDVTDISADERQRLRDRLSQLAEAAS